jgi:hypothetical protein
VSAREEELLQRVEALIAETQRDAERVARQDAERDQRREEAARSGALGPDWQEVQRRVDAGDTTLQDVFGGTDTTPAALRLREQSRARIEATAAELPLELREEAEAAEHDLDRIEGRA